MKAPSLVIILPSVGVFRAAKANMATLATILYGISKKQLGGSPKIHFIEGTLTATLTALSD